MSLNIKDDEAHKLAQALADETGESMTKAVATAIRERLERVRRSRKQKATTADLLSIGRSCAEHMRGTSADHAGFLYDEGGLPK